MQLTIELDADQIAHLAHIAEMMEISAAGDAVQMHGVNPLEILRAMNYLLNSFNDLLDKMDSPFQAGPETSQAALILTDKLNNIRESILEDQARFETLQTQK